MNGKVEPKQQYCRACGTGKGHSFSYCKNAPAMRKIIQSQDAEMERYLQQARLKGTNALLHRLLEALLDLAEAKREQARP